MSFNKITLVGNLGRDPELRYTSQGTAVCSFSMATNERRKVDGEQQDITTWFRVTLWGKQAELASKHLVKGRQVYIEGTLRQDEYTDKDGKARTSLEVNANDMRFIGSRDADGAAGAGGGEKAQGAVAGAGGVPSSVNNPKEDDEIPF